MRVLSIGIYLGIGAMLHAMFIGPQFDWSSAWTFGYLFGWPIMIFIWFGKVFLFLAIVGIAFGVGVWIWESTFMWRHQRAIRKMAAKHPIKKARP